MRLLSIFFAILNAAGQLAVAEEIKLTPPAVVGDKSTAIQWLITTIFLVGCLVVAFKPAKRSKLD